MQAVRRVDSRIEISLRKALWKKGFRFRKNFEKVYGRPDIAFISLRIAIFCDSEFWHGYDWETRQHDFKSNQEFWIKKIQRNIERDQEVNTELEKQGWLVLRFWGRDIKNNLDGCVSMVEDVYKKRHLQINQND